MPFNDFLISEAGVIQNFDNHRPKDIVGICSDWAFGNKWVEKAHGLWSPALINPLFKILYWPEEGKKPPIIASIQVLLERNIRNFISFLIFQMEWKQIYFDISHSLVLCVGGSQLT